MTSLDADAAAYVLIKAELINSYVSTEKPLVEWICHRWACLVSTDICNITFVCNCDVICVLFCGSLSAYFVCEDRTLISFFKSGNASDNSLERFLAGWSKR